MLSGTLFIAKDAITLYTATNYSFADTTQRAGMPANKPHIAASFHHSFLEAIRHEADAAHVLAKIIVKKLCGQGFDGAKHFDH